MYNPFDPTSNPAIWHPPYKDNVPFGPFDAEIRRRSQLEEALNPQILGYPFAGKFAGKPVTPPLRPGQGPFGPILTPAEHIKRAGERLEREARDMENQIYREDSMRIAEDAKIRGMERELQKYPTGTKRDY